MLSFILFIVSVHRPINIPLDKRTIEVLLWANSSTIHVGNKRIVAVIHGSVPCSKYCAHKQSCRVCPRCIGIRT